MRAVLSLAAFLALASTPLFSVPAPLPVASLGCVTDSECEGIATFVRSPSPAPLPALPLAQAE